ncbi:MULTISPECIES: glycosyltransferase family 4 protein [Sphingomonas]|uniref:glycosyltransferase family 4 protein n=1 Tax=Sphingomonas TaxID=13687 RepID=UPI0015EC0993|nr:glycosyltransferase family 4 protein [Sphingomonas sp. CGMCC 1.13658]MBA2918192.1 glycosyltransferase family 4 protein [Sphingomonas sp. CGMCC 1.13658]
MTVQKLRVALVSASDPSSTAGFSGTLLSAYRALQPQFEALVPIHVDLLLKVSAKLSGLRRRLTGRHANYYFHPLFSAVAARLVGRAVRAARPDVIVCVAASSVLSRLKTDVPIVYCTDGTFQSLTRLYPKWRGLPRWNVENGNTAEARSLDRASAIVVSSNWARDSAVDDYGIDPAKIAILPYGPNLRADLLPPAEPPVIGDPARELQLLYVGLDWQRKGGDFAVDVVRLLNEMGCATRLNLVGRVPDRVAALPFVTWHGSLNKDVPAEAERMADIYRHAHMFILPTIADATPVVFSEAAAFALPAITFDVGGVASAVPHGRSGLVFPMGTDPATVARDIADIVARGDRLAALRASSYSWSRDVANWSHWGAAVAELALEAYRRARPGEAVSGEDEDERPSAAAFALARK